MRIIPISEISAMVHNEVIAGVKGKIKTIYKRQAGGQGEKAWTKQDMELQDATGTIKVTIWNKDEIPTASKGKEVTILAHQSTKGLSSVYAWDNEYQGRTTRGVKVTAAGEIAFIGTLESAQPTSPTSQTNAAQAQSATTQSDSTTNSTAQKAPAKSTPKTEADVKAVEHFMMQQINLALIASRAAIYYARRHNELYPDFKFTQADIRELTTRFYLGAEFKGMTAKMPSSPL